MDYKHTYSEIILPVKSEIERFDRYVMNEFLADKSEISTLLKSCISEGKKIRPALIFLLTKALENDVDEDICKLAFVNEIIHNATLIHDDIIDCSLLRRGKSTLNASYDNKLAVLAGDFLLTKALSKLADFEEKKIQNLYTHSLSTILKGETAQYFEKAQKPNLENYIDKCRKKTAELFKAGLVSACILKNYSEQTQKQVKEFAYNFGTAFQIRNDIEGIEEDLKNNVYTAPIIFFKEENQNGPFDVNAVQNSSAIEKTRDLIMSFTKQAIENINFIKDNQYKQAMASLCKMLNQ